MHVDKCVLSYIHLTIVILCTAPKFALYLMQRPSLLLSLPRTTHIMSPLPKHLHFLECYRSEIMQHTVVLLLSFKKPQCNTYTSLMIFYMLELFNCRAICHFMDALQFVRHSPILFSCFQFLCIVIKAAISIQVEGLCEPLVFSNKFLVLLISKCTFTDLGHYPTIHLGTFLPV